jgi:hypothetical protein
LRGGFVGQTHLGLARPLGSLGRAGFEHQLQRADLLMRRGHRAAGFVGFNLRGLDTLVLHCYLGLAPLQQMFEVAKQVHGQRDARRGLLRGVNLHQHHAHARLRGGKQTGLFLDHQLALGEHAALLVQSATALIQRHLEGSVLAYLH